MERLRHWRKELALWLVCAMALCLPATARAEPTHPPVGGSAPCWAALPAGEPIAVALAQARWDCRLRMSALSGRRIAARFPAADARGRAVTHLEAGLGTFDRMTLASLSADGSLRAVALGPDATVPLLGEPSFAAAFPQVQDATARYVVFDGLRSAYTAKTLTARTEPPGSGARAHTDIILLAVLVGMLLVPAMLDLAIFRVLRQRFFLYHGLLTLSVAMLAAAWSGLVLELADLGMAGWYRSLMLAMGVTATAAPLFMRAFVKECAANTWMSRSLGVAAGYSAAVTLLYVAGLLDPVLPPGTLAYAFIPVQGLLCAALLVIHRHGDRAARFQVWGWVPLLLFFLLHISADVFGFHLPAKALPLLYLGVLVETVASVVSVGRRFLAVSRERDRAQARAHVMGDLAERDHLTGLLNRRAIDNRFDDLRGRGYDTLALIDLDHFKTINDVSGHAVGDQVLEITARVLASDPDNIAVRLGGEEFLLLLRGSDASARAEKLRRMLSVRVAREVNGLEQIVTASMGLLSLPGDAQESLSFSHAYSRADLLLYEAKRDGRNRTKAAHWRFFNHRAEELAGPEDIRDRSPAPAAA